MVDIFSEIVQLKEKGLTGVIATVISKRGEGPCDVGKKILVVSDGSIFGTVGGGEIEKEAVKKAKDLIEKKDHAIESYDFSGECHVNGIKDLDMICGGYITIFYEYIGTNPKLYVFGAGHVGKNIVKLAKNLNYEITIFESEENTTFNNDTSINLVKGSLEENIKNTKIGSDSFVIICAYSHDIDFKILKLIMENNWNPSYIGMLASPNKASVIVQKVKNELGEVNFSMLHAPVGLDIGGDSPEEIAISVISEVQAQRYKKNGGHLSRKW